MFEVATTLRNWYIPLDHSCLNYERDVVEQLESGGSR